MPTYPRTTTAAIAAFLAAGGIAGFVISTIRGQALALDGQSTVPARGVYEQYDYGVTLDLKQHYSPTGTAVGEQLGLQMTNSSGTSGLGFYTNGGDCGVMQFFSVSSGAPLLTYVPNDVNLASQSCVDQGLDTLTHGIFLGNGQIGSKENILPFTVGEQDFGSTVWPWKTFFGGSSLLNGTGAFGSSSYVYPVTQEVDMADGSHWGNIWKNLTGGYAYGTLIENNGVFRIADATTTRIDTVIGFNPRELPYPYGSSTFLDYDLIPNGNVGSQRSVSLGRPGLPLNNIQASGTASITSIRATNLNVATSSAATATYYVCADSSGNVYKKTTACN